MGIKRRLTGTGITQRVTTYIDYTEQCSDAERAPVSISEM